MMLKQRLRDWEMRLVGLNQMVDHEWAVKDRLHVKSKTIINLCIFMQSILIAFVTRIFKPEICI